MTVTQEEESLTSVNKKSVSEVIDLFHITSDQYDESNFSHQ